MITKQSTITKEYLLDKAKYFDDPKDFIRYIQAELGVFDESNRNWDKWKENRENHKYQFGEDILMFIENLHHGRGWFYIAENIWREAHGLKVNQL